VSGEGRGVREPAGSQPAPPAPEREGSSHLFWTAYGLAWVSYALGYGVIAFVQGGEPLAGLLVGITFVIPASALGVGVVHLAHRWDWTPSRPWRFTLRHLTAAAAFSALWTLGASALRTLWGVLQGVAEGFDLLGGFQSVLLAAHLLIGFLVYGAIAAIVHLLQARRRLRLERERTARAEALQARAQLRALRARLDPHFLFNSLHSVLSLIRTAPERAERAVESLGDLLRYAVGRDEGDRRERVTLARELEMVRTYLELEKVRLGDRLRSEEAVPAEARSVLVPPLTVQPLVENAVQHGAAESRDGATVRLSARLEPDGPGSGLEVTVRDDGPGAEPEALHPSRDGSGLALVRRRLELLYGDEASLELETAPGEGVEARVRVPVAADEAPQTRKGAHG